MTRQASEVRRGHGSTTIRLETRKRDGTWVPSPVSLATAEGHAYFRTYDASGKAKRLRNFPEVRYAPCTLRGRPKSQTVEGTARLLDGAEAARARRVLAQAYPVLHRFLVPLIHRLKGWTTLHYALEP